MNKWIAIMAAAGLLIVGAVAVPAISAGTSAQISGCVSTKTGVLRIANTCKPGERRMAWMSQGVAGERGLQGLQGLSGPSGANGANAVNFASNCYQWLKQAESLGFLWGVAADRTRFETLTGCTIRNIDLNPNSQVPGFYPNFAPQILSANLLALNASSGEGSPEDFAFAAANRGIYEINLRKPAGMEICSSLNEMQRVFENPDTSKIYAVAAIAVSHQRTTTDITVGWGEAANTVVRSSTQEVAGVESYVIDGSNSNNIQLVFEPLPASVPLGSNVKIRLKKILVNNVEQDSGFEATVSGSYLSQITRAPDEVGALAVFNVQSNNFERGAEQITFVFNSPDFATQVTHNFHVGVQGCNISQNNFFEDYPLEGMSNTYRIRETRPMPAILDGPALQNLIGWNTREWFPTPIG